LDYSSTYGNSGELFAAAGRRDTASLVVSLPKGSDGEILAESFRSKLAGPNRTISIAVAASGGGPSSNDLEEVLVGENYAAVVEAANGLTAEIQKMSGVINVSNDASSADPDAPIVRVDGQRAVTIRGTITAKNTQSVQRQVQTAAALVVPAGVELKTGGVFQDVDRTFRQMGIAMLAGMLLVYVVMVVTQRSFVTPFVIMLSLPLAAIGAIGALFVTQRALGLPALMGILMLVGLVVTNAIVLMAFVEQLRARGTPLREALLQAGLTRLRPILMTALTTIFVLVPLALGLGGESAGLIGAELATVVIGGLFTSTFLTLVVVPVVYTFLRRRGPKVRPDATAS
jgi:multidrug efflux pump subunit AcrB